MLVNLFRSFCVFGSGDRRGCQFTYDIEQVADVKWFDDHVVYTEGGGSGAVNACGNDDNRGMRMGCTPLGAEFFQECASVHDGHGQIEENHVGVASLASGIIDPG
jgi:hypothetical protein